MLCLGLICLLCFDLSLRLIAVWQLFVVGWDLLLVGICCDGVVGLCWVLFWVLRVLLWLLFEMFGMFVIAGG